MADGSGRSHDLRWQCSVPYGKSSRPQFVSVLDDSESDPPEQPDRFFVTRIDVGQVTAPSMLSHQQAKRRRADAAFTPLLENRDANFVHRREINRADIVFAQFDQIPGRVRPARDEFTVLLPVRHDTMADIGARFAFLQQGVEQPRSPFGQAVYAHEL